MHRAKKVRQWVQAHADHIELQFLPGYSPELNPTELLNQDVKTTPSAAAGLTPKTN